MQAEKFYENEENSFASRSRAIGVFDGGWSSRTKTTDQYRWIFNRLSLCRNCC